jgi:hypothetical protein
VRHTGINKWSDELSDSEKNDIKGNINKNLRGSKNHKIIFNENYVEVRRRLMKRGAMFDEASFGLGPAPEINFGFVDSFIFDQDSRRRRLSKLHLQI